MRTQLLTSNTTSELITDVRLGLTKAGQKELPSKYLYDSVGSALFEVISVLPEYGLTRADERILRRHSEDVVARLTPPTTVAELGSGSGKKTRWMLEALSRHRHVSYCPIEISPTALTMCERELGADFRLEQFEHVARFNENAGSMEMHIRSRKRQTVNIPAAALSVSFLEGETIWTESSHKYSLAEIFRIAGNAGFRCDAQWIDDEWPFAENLLIAA